MRIIDDQILNITSLATTSSEAVDIQHEWTWSIQYVWTGDPTGTLTVEISNDGVTWTNYTDFATALTNPAGSAGNTIAMPKYDAGYKYIRTTYTHTSSTSGTLKAYIFTKGV